MAAAFASDATDLTSSNSPAPMLGSAAAAPSLLPHSVSASALERIEARRADFSGGPWKSRGNEIVEHAVADTTIVPATGAPQKFTLDAAEASALRKIAREGKKPGPGDYAWKDEVHLRKRPVCSMKFINRKQMDLAVPAWCPAPTSLQPRAPDPAEYSILDYNAAVGRNGKMDAAKWSWDRNTPGECRQPLLKESISLPPTRHFAMVGGSHHPTKPMKPNWSMNSPIRDRLPLDVPTWVPKANSELRPGPGQYYSEKQLRKPTARTHCSFGGRPPNLPPLSRDWQPLTQGAYQPSCEHLRGKGSIRKVVQASAFLSPLRASKSRRH